VVAVTAVTVSILAIGLPQPLLVTLAITLVVAVGAKEVLATRVLVALAVVAMVVTVQLMDLTRQQTLVAVVVELVASPVTTAVLAVQES
jgi:hypothetical protein